MSDFGRLFAQPNTAGSEESDIVLVFENPVGEMLEIDWKIRFPFPVTCSEKMSGTVWLQPDKTKSTCWTTALAGLPPSQKEAVWNLEIEVELQLSAGSVFLQDGIGATLAQLRCTRSRGPA